MIRAIWFFFGFLCGVVLSLVVFATTAQAYVSDTGSALPACTSDGYPCRDDVPCCSKNCAIDGFCKSEPCGTSQAKCYADWQCCNDDGCNPTGHCN